ncbi:MAG: DUF481 domain-containing protein [Lentimicrobiaceae bacterium]|nr:DUF481 domain-containing protein [Lentimicrobiaceae bacterium]
MMKKTLFLYFLWIYLIPANATAQVLNIERERLKTDTTGLAGSVKVNVNLIKNVEKLTEIGFFSHLQYKTPRSLYLLLLDYNLIKSVKDDFSNKGMSHLRFNYKLTPVVSLEIFTQAQFNKVLGINFRALAGAGPRFKVIGNDHFRLYSGLAWMIEHEEPVKIESDLYQMPVETVHRASSYLSFTINVTDNLLITNTTYYQPRPDKFNDYRISTDLAAIFKITEMMSFSFSYVYLYDKVPSVGVPDLVYTIKNSLIIDFGR